MARLTRTSVLSLLFVVLLPSAARASLHDGVEALARGQADEAIGHFEVLANQGVVDAHVSFDRGLAYAARLAQGHAHPGDFGQAIAAFEEAEALTGDATLRERADRAADAVRGELAKKRHGEGARAAFEPAPSLSDRSLGLLGETAWLVLACAFSVAGTLGALSRRAGLARWLLAAAGLLLVPCLAAAWTVRGRSAREAHAVVIAESARLLDEETRRPLAEAEPLVEGASIVVEPLGNELRVRAARISGLLPRTSARLLAR